MGGGTSKAKKAKEEEEAATQAAQQQRQEKQQQEEEAKAADAPAKAEKTAGGTEEEKKGIEEEEEEKASESASKEGKDGEESGTTLKLVKPTRESEKNRFRVKKTGFTGFRAVENDEFGSNEGTSGLRVQGDAEKSAAERAKAVAHLKDGEFTLFDEEAAEPVLNVMGVATCPAGKDIFVAGRPFLYFVLLVDGEMALGGAKVGFANEQALLGPAPCPESLVAVTDCKMWVISRLQYQKATVSALKSKLERGGNLLENITEIPGLKELSSGQREAIAAALKPVTFARGDFLMKQGEQGHIMYFIEEGEVEIKQAGGRSTAANNSELGNETVVAQRGPGEYVGEGSLLEEGIGTRNASAVACSDEVRCLALGRHEFSEYMGSLRELFEHNLCFRVLKSLELTKDLDEAQLSVLVSTLEEAAYEPGQYIVHQGELGENFYILKEGTCECTLTEEEGGEAKRIGTLIAGDVFGEGALLTNAPRRANVYAVGPGTTKLWALSRENFENFLSDGLKEKLGTTFQHRKTAKEGGASAKKDVEWSDLQKSRTLGSGSYGTVDLVRHRVTGETYALKRIRKATVVAKKQQRFVKNERELMGVLHSPFVVNLVCTFHKGDSVYMLTEVCLGGELYSLMKDTVDERNKHVEDDDELICGCFELESQCRFYTACIVLAIEYIHSKGIIHRDIKPENLLLNEQGYLKLADMGFAKMVNDQRTYSLCGTPEYTAPEVYKRSGHSKGVDWWSMGVIVYEMASGFSPFHVVSQNSWDCYIEISKYEKYFPSISFPDFNPELCDFLLRLMHPNPTKRYGTRKLTASHVKEHPFFHKNSEFTFATDWDGIAAQTFQLDDQYRPRPPESGLDANNFEACDDRHEDDEKYVDDAALESQGDWADEF